MTDFFAIKSLSPLAPTGQGPLFSGLGTNMASRGGARAGQGPSLGRLNDPTPKGPSSFAQALEKSQAQDHAPAQDRGRADGQSSAPSQENQPEAGRQPNPAALARKNKVLADGESAGSQSDDTAGSDAKDNPSQTGAHTLAPSFFAPLIQVPTNMAQPSAQTDGAMAADLRATGAFAAMNQYAQDGARSNTLFQPFSQGRASALTTLMPLQLSDSPGSANAVIDAMASAATPLASPWDGRLGQAGLPGSALQNTAAQTGASPLLWTTDDMAQAQGLAARMHELAGALPGTSMSFETLPGKQLAMAEPTLVNAQNNAATAEQMFLDLTRGTTKAAGETPSWLSALTARQERLDHLGLMHAQNTPGNNPNQVWMGPAGLETGTQGGLAQLPNGMPLSQTSAFASGEQASSMEPGLFFGTNTEAFAANQAGQASGLTNLHAAAFGNVGNLNAHVGAHLSNTPQGVSEQGAKLAALNPEVQAALDPEHVATAPNPLNPANAQNVAAAPNGASFAAQGRQLGAPAAMAQAQLQRDLRPSLLGNEETRGQERDRRDDSEASDSNVDSLSLTTFFDRQTQTTQDKGLAPTGTAAAQPSDVTAAIQSRVLDTAGRMMLSGATGQARLTVRDSQLGSVDVLVQVSADKRVAVDLRAGSDEMRQRLEAQVDDLRDRLQNEKFQAVDVRLVSEAKASSSFDQAGGRGGRDNNSSNSGTGSNQSNQPSEGSNFASDGNGGGRSFEGQRRDGDAGGNWNSTNRTNASSENKLDANAKRQSYQARDRDASSANTKGKLSFRA